MQGILKRKQVSQFQSLKRLLPSNFLPIRAIRIADDAAPAPTLRHEAKGEADSQLMFKDRWFELQSRFFRHMPPIAIKAQPFCLPP